MDFLGLWKASSDAEEEIGDIPRKVDQLKHSYSNLKKHYEKLGSAGIKGSLYQIDVLTMVLLNAMRKVKSWRLSTEDKAAAQLDDLIFEHLPSQSTILLQAKHKEDEKKEVTYQDLMSVNKNSEFSLPKYFFSYQEVKNRFRVQMVVICTNLKLDKKTKSILKEEGVDPGSVLHFEGAENICYGFSGCSLPELKQNMKSYHTKYVHNEEANISDEDINDFLNHLKLFPNCLCDKNVGDVAQKTISRMQFSENLSVKMIQKGIHKKMTDWFKEKKGRYLTEVEAKAFFCDMRSNKYCDGLKLYDISFKGNKLPLIILQTRQENNQKGPQPRDPKRISHIIPGKEYVLNVVKIYQALPTQQKETTLFVNPDEVVQVQKEIIDAFRVQHYTLLVMVCPGEIEEPAAKEMSDIVTEILDTYKYKHVILIAEERNNLATHIKNAYVNYYEDITDNLTFADLEDAAQEEFKRKRLIDFQGCTVSLEELFPPSTKDLNQIVNSEMLIKLARGRKTKVGLELPRPDNYYISRSFNRCYQNISEEDLWRSTEASEEKIILISDSAGMGKSSVLTSLGVSIKRANPHLWVVRLDLINCTNVLEIALKEGRKSVSLVEMLNPQELKSEFDKKLFATPKRVVLMLDGVNEISPTYTKLVVNLIRDSLAQVNLAKIIATARSHFFRESEGNSEEQSLTLESDDHEEEIQDIKPFKFEPFSKVNQKAFLVKYWTGTLDLQDDARKSRCKIYAEALIENVSAWLKEDRNNFAEIPLQTRMLAEIFQEENQTQETEDWEGCKEFSSSNNEEPKFPTRLDIMQLYELFVDKKCDIFIKKSNPSIAADEALKHQLEKCKNCHRAWALQAIFESDKRLQFFTRHKTVERPLPTTLANAYLLKVGIVQRQGGNIKFIHRTFAEYFVAQCLLMELNRKPLDEAFQRFFMKSIMMDKEFHVVRAFLNSPAPNVVHIIEHNFCSYFRQNRTSSWSLSRYFAVLAEGGCARILESIIKSVQQEVLSETVKDVHLMDNALYFAIRYNHLNVLRLLLELNETFNKATDAHKEFLRKAISNAIKFNLEAFQFLLCQADKDGESIMGRSALHQAAYTGRFEEVAALVEHSGADINAKDDILGWTAVYEAVYMGRLEAAKFLVQKAGADVNIKDNDGETPLHKTAYWSRLEVVRFSAEETEAKDEVAQRKPAYRSRLEVARFLVEELGADIYTRDNQGWTALHKNAYWGRLEVVQFLVEEAAADINVRDNVGETALHKTAYWSRSHVAKFLVDKAGADINVKNTEGETALHKAAYWREIRMVQFLVEETKADINVMDINGWTALHMAARQGDLEIVELLVDGAGADVNVKDNRGMTALRVAADRGSWEVVKFLSNSSRWVMFKMRMVYLLHEIFPC